MAEGGRRSRRRSRRRAPVLRASAATTFASGLPERRGGRSSSLRRRILLQLIPGLLFIALALAGAAVVDRLDLGEGDASSDAETPEPCTTPSASRPGPEIDLGVDPGGGQGKGVEPGSRVSYEPLDRSRVRQLVRQAKRAGASTISTRALLRDLKERPSSLYGWGPLDRVINAARSEDLKVRLRVGTMPSYAFDRVSLRASTGQPDRWRPPLTDDELGRWSRFLETLTRHVEGRVDYIEVWNEPNRERFWPTGPDPEAFARLLEASHEAIASVDPSITVISGGLRHNDLGFLEATYAAADELFGGTARLFDQVGVHPFSGDRAPDVRSPRWVVDGPWGEVDRTFLGHRSLLDVMRRHGDAAKRLYVGAFGYSTQAQGQVEGVPDETRAAYLTEALEALTCSPGVSAISWYAYYPSASDAPAWALLSRRGRANETYRTLVRWGERVGASG